MFAILQIFDTGKSVKVTNGTVIGRSSSCDITLHSESVSSEHAKIVEENGVLYLEDLGSKNKFTYMGEAYKRLPIEDNMTVRLGTELLSFSFPQKFDFCKRLKKLSENIQKKSLIENSENLLFPFKRPLDLCFMKGPQSGFGLTIYYGPYPIGSESLFLPSLDPKAPAICFQLKPVEGALAQLISTYKNLKVNDVLISEGSIDLHSEDTISLGSLCAQIRASQVAL